MRRRETEGLAPTQPNAPHLAPGRGVATVGQGRGGGRRACAAPRGGGGHYWSLGPSIGAWRPAHFVAGEAAPRMVPEGKGPFGQGPLGAANAPLCPGRGSDLPDLCGDLLSKWGEGGDARGPCGGGAGAPRVLPGRSEEERLRGVLARPLFRMGLLRLRDGGGASTPILRKAGLLGRRTCGPRRHPGNA